MKHILGVDIGLKGGLAVIDGQEKIVEMRMMPDLVDLALIVLEMHSAYSFEKAYVENVHAMPAQGVSSTFNFGLSFGFVRGVLSALHIETILVSPQKWQTALFKSYNFEDPEMNTKTKALMVAKDIWPKEDFLATKRSTVPNSGLVDASLIALYGVRYGN